MDVVNFSLILPARSETVRLVPKLSAIIKFFEQKRNKSKQFQYEIIMIDDGSRTPVADILACSHLALTIRSLIKQKRFKGYRLEKNCGKGRAIAIGVSYAKGDIVAFLDIDFSESIAMVIKAMCELKDAEVVIGSRRIKGSVIAVRQPLLREIWERIYTAVSQTLFGLSLSGFVCGYNVYARNIAKDLFSRLTIDRWAFEMELLVMAKARGYRIKEFPVSRSNMKGSKVEKIDIVQSVVNLGRILWNTWIGVYDQALTKENKQREQLVGECDSCKGSSWRFLFDHHNGLKVQRCRQCGLVQVMPRPSQEAIVRLYKDDASRFDPYLSQESVHREYFQKKLAHLQRILKKTKTIRLLDVGCLTGVLLEEAREKEITAEGVDISKNAVSHCKAKGLTVYHGTVETTWKKYLRKRYDAITAFEIIEHVYSPRQMMETVHKMLKPGGFILLTTPNHGSLWRKIMGKRWPGYTHPEHLYFFDESSLHFLLSSCQFRDIRIARGDSRPFPLWYLFSRGEDYFPAFRSVLRIFGRVAQHLPFKNPLNPWDNLFVVARK